VLGRALTWLAPAGELHVVDCGGQERLPGWFRTGLRRWLDVFHGTPRAELEAELTLRGLRSGASTGGERPDRGYAQDAICRRLAG
jgi:S-adenosylmethionine-diacylgycerolhomoserine-N-methlytransferase